MVDSDKLKQCMVLKHGTEARVFRGGGLHPLTACKRIKYIFALGGEGGRETDNTWAASKIFHWWR